MPDEMVTDDIVTEVDSSDAQSAEEFLFGHAERETAQVAAAAEVTEEEDSQGDLEEEAKVEPQDSQDSDEPGDEIAPLEELKVVLSIKGGMATIGVQQPSADPHIEAFDSLDLSGLVREVPAMVERAKARWEDAPKFPAHERPTPPARRQRQRRQEPASASAGVGEADQQQLETLRLF